MLKLMLFDGKLPYSLNYKGAGFVHTSSKAHEEFPEASLLSRFKSTYNSYFEFWHVNLNVLHY